MFGNFFNNAKEFWTNCDWILSPSQLLLIFLVSLIPFFVIFDATQRNTLQYGNISCFPTTINSVSAREGKNIIGMNVSCSVPEGGLREFATNDAEIILMRIRDNTNNFRCDISLSNEIISCIPNNQ